MHFGSIAKKNKKQKKLTDGADDAGKTDETGLGINVKGTHVLQVGV